MQICQNSHCSHPFNAQSNLFCISCGSRNFGELLRNRYRVLRLLGEGGFGKTYAAEDGDRLNAPCVIKQFFPQFQGTSARTKAAQLFKEEAIRLYELGENHSQIPRLLAFFEQGSSLYLVQEFIEGKTLLEELKAQTFSEDNIREILADLLPVLEYIHAHNIIHRDIKPDNIIRRHNPTGCRKTGQLVLIDFGGAKQVTQASVGRQGTVLYTLGYAPVEQMAGFACHSSDLYSLGATCVRLLTQCLPIHHTNGRFEDLVYDAMNGQWLWQEFLQQKGVTVSNELGYILNKLLKNLASERYQSAADVLIDLHSTPVSLPPIPQPTRSLPNLQTFEFEVVRVDTNGRKTGCEQHQAKFLTENLGKGIILEMVSIPGDTFQMGSPENEGNTDERPQHLVSVEPFFMGKFPVTQAQWKAVAALPKVNQALNINPSKFKSVNRPVENISWHEAEEFCARLSKKTQRQYRLPSEAEWEYACRAGTNTTFHFGETLVDNFANFNNNSQLKLLKRKQTTPVGYFQVANAFGLYDMHGLVWEWCADPWHKNYNDAPCDGQVWDTGGDKNRRVLRGGSWRFSRELCRSASRSWNELEGGLRICGLRVVFSV